MTTRPNPYDLSIRRAAQARRARTAVAASVRPYAVAAVRSAAPLAEARPAGAVSANPYDLASMRRRAPR